MAYLLWSLMFISGLSFSLECKNYFVFHGAVHQMIVDGDDQAFYTFLDANPEQADDINKLIDDIFDEMLHIPPELREKDFGVSKRLVDDIRLWLGLNVFEDLSFVSNEDRRPYLEGLVTSHRIMNPRYNSAYSRYFYYLFNVTKKSIPQLARELGFSEGMVREELSLLRIHLKEEYAGVDLDRNREADEFFMHYLHEINRGIKWSDLEERRLQNLHAIGKTYHQMALILTREFKFLRTEGAVAAKLDQLGKTKKVSRISKYKLKGYGWVLSRGALTDQARQFIWDHRFESPLWLAAKLKVHPKSVLRFAERHGIPLGITGGSPQPEGYRKINRLSDQDKQEVKNRYRKQRGEFTYDEYINLLDQYVDKVLDGKRGDLTTSDKNSSRAFTPHGWHEEIKLKKLLAWYGMAAYKVDHGKLPDGLNTNTLLKQEGYSIKELINRYKREKGFKVGSLPDLTYADYMDLLDQFVNKVLKRKRGDLSTSPKKLSSVFIPNGWHEEIRLETLLKWFGLAAYKVDHGQLTDGLNTTTIFKQEGYSRKELVNRYKSEKGDKVVDSTDLTYDDYMGLLDQFVKKALKGKRGDLTTGPKNLKSAFTPNGWHKEIKLEKLLKWYGLEAYKVDHGKLANGVNTMTIYKQEGYSLKELIQRYKSEKGDKVVDFTDLTYDDYTDLLDQFVKKVLGGKRGDLTTSGKNLSRAFTPNGWHEEIKLLKLLKWYGLEAYKVDHGQQGDGVNTATIFQQEGYSQKELINRYKKEKETVSQH